MFERYVRVILRDARNCLRPKLWRFEPRRFINRRPFTATLARSFKCNTRDALDLFDRVAHRVTRDGRAVCRVDAARLAEVQTTEQLAHDEYVSAVRDFRTHGGTSRD